MLIGFVMGVVAMALIGAVWCVLNGEDSYISWKGHKFTSSARNTPSQQLFQPPLRSLLNRLFLPHQQSLLNRLRRRMSRRVA